MDMQACIHPHSVSERDAEEWQHQPDVDGVQRALIWESDQLDLDLLLFLPAQMLPSTCHM